jgi:hypothetical protein
MRDLDNFYSKVLYPFQDGVIRILRNLRTPFFLTGGTALARGYLGHRYSDDLDFFVNDDPWFLEYVRAFETALLKAAGSETWSLDEGGTIRTDRFISFSLLRGEDQLKIDLVNDIAFRIGIPSEREGLGLVDTLGNILSNKIGALSRYAEKDIADIWAIWKEYGADWAVVLRDSSRKDAGTDAVTAAEIIASFPPGRFDNIRWSRCVDRSAFMADLRTIANEILGL